MNSNQNKIIVGLKPEKKFFQHVKHIRCFRKRYNVAETNKEVTYKVITDIIENEMDLHLPVSEINRTH